MTHHAASNGVPRSGRRPSLAHVALETEVQYLKGVGPVRARAFEKLGIRTVADLIEYFPFRHELRPKSMRIGHLELDKVATIVGELQRVQTRGFARRMTMNATCVDATGECRVRWFNSPYLAGTLHQGLVVRLTGKVELYRDVASMTNPTLTIIDDKQDPFADDEDHYIPVYSGTAELPSSRINRAVLGCLDHVIDSVVDFLPDDLRRERDLPPRRTAILRYHKPTSPEDVDVARRRLAYEELLFSQLAVRLARQMQRTGPKAHPVEVTDEIERRIRARLPFALTAGQDQAVSQILADMSKQVPMNRMLQADVGAGKTAVAVFAALAAIANRHQVALLAPTEVLARQHSDKIQQYLTGSRVGTGFLAGSTSRSDRREMLDDLAHGRIDWAIGTHALLEDDVAFSNLGLVIIDEQHKFGVAQRARLRSKGFAPHNLVLSATPIPRTLAMTVFGDLDVSIIEGTLPNRQPIDTRLVTPEQSTQAWEFVRKRLGKGEQAYVVYPLVEESETIQRKAATVEAGRLAHHELSGFRIGLLHGRMNPAEKHQVMQQFHAGDVNVLVSTTVIEVGVDVPNATMMIIQHSNAYGLSQLHQLRGRVGRGSRRSFCLLFCDTQEQSSTSPASQRFNILCETNDGFRIAEEDLRIRGPGELLGKRQHGIPEFRVANLVEDLDLLQLARDDAQRLLAADVHLADPEHKLLKSALMHRYSRSLNLIDVA